MLGLELEKSIRNEKDDFKGRILLVRLLEKIRKNIHVLKRKSIVLDGGHTNGSKDLIMLVWKTKE